MVGETSNLSFMQQLGGAAKKLNGLGNWGAMGGDILSGLGQFAGQYTTNYGDTFNDSQRSTQSMIRSGLAMIPGYGQIIAAATGALDAIGSMTGTNLSNINKDSASRLGLKGAATTNNIINHIPGISALSGGWGLWSERTNGYQLSDEAEEMQAGYSGTLGDLRATEDIAGKRMFGSKRWGAAGKANNVIDIARRNDRILADINETNTMRKQSNYYQDLAHQNINRYAGQNYLGITIGRNGLKLMSIEQAKAILSGRQKLTKLQNGGIVGVDQSVLPVGALHKELHHIEDTNPELAEEITRKGIPVVSINENGDVQQVAEIERYEFLMRKSLTDEVEKLRKIGTEEAMIQCGKIVSNEIINKTEDNDNVIENG